jgi:DNA relaxase NicK
MGCHVSAMGGGCRAIATRPGFPGWQDWMKNMLRWEGARFSRLDVAIDDAAGPFASLPGVRSMYEELVAGNAVHRAELRNVSLISNAAGAGDTLYVGSRQSGTYVRAYDKGLERGLDAAVNWVRVEVELKGRRAHAMAAAMAEWGFTCVGGVLRSALDFKVAQPDRNKSRWPTAGWWLSFLGQAEKVCLAVAEPLRSIERSVWHLREQYGPTLAALMYAARGDVEWLGTLACQGLARVKPHHRRMVSEFRAKGGDFDRLVAAVA